MDIAPEYESVSYRRQEPEQTLLHRAFLEHLETFLDRTRTEASDLPKYAERELRAFVEYGVLAHGFVRIRCEGCTKNMVVGFSCKGRVFCPSCTGRREKGSR